MVCPHKTVKYPPSHFHACRYWGDFFFLLDQDLTFDGIFQMFPHPMYTVGYSAYYGMSLLMRSLPLLHVSMVAHLSQLLFLAIVEDPHIQRTYQVRDCAIPRHV